MPTRIVLQETTPVRRPAGNVRRVSSPQTQTPAVDGPHPRPRPLPSNTPYSFQKSIRGGRNGNEDGSEQPPQDSDIHSSPRMTCYINSLLCSCIMLISIVQFYFKEDDKVAQYHDEEFYIGNYGVYLWKLQGAFCVSAAGITIYLLILLAHFDTICFPDFCTSFFRDGSKGERNLIYVLILFWIGGVYLCTSDLSVGSAQPNVYFTSWIAFGTNLRNYNVWRTCAGYRRWSEIVKSSPRETTFNWTWTLFFALVASLGASDSYSSRDELSFYFEGKEVHEEDRKLGMILAWMSVVICIIVLLGNLFWTQEYRMTCCKRCQITLDWRQFEGAFLVGMLAMYGYVIFVFTGTQGIFNSPSNTYFGIWGTFFSAVVTLGTWIKENRNFLMLRVLPLSQTGSTRNKSSLRQSASSS